MTPPGIDRLVEAVQTNCHIADARGAADLTLCIYLLQMRELYRWEQGIAVLQPLPRDDVARWLAAREALWAELETRDFAPLPLAGQGFDPFDVAGINLHLRPWGLVYGAGQVAPGRASFFLGRLERRDARDELELLVCGDELARGLAAPVAALQGSTVWLRQQSLQRWLAEKYEAWTLKRQDGAFKSALDAHGFQHDGVMALQRMVRQQGETLVLHELGEFEAGRRLGPDWQALRAALASRRADLYLRALRDHLADCLVTLPALLQRRDEASLHFWFANLEGVRALMFPRLGPAYAAWCAGDQGAALRDAVSTGAAHWGRACMQLLEIHRTQGEEAPAAIERCVQWPDWVLA
ncbi:MAG: hypothetical protein H6R06_2630 [Proteobacteria bacterium]|nr:hypothetical protein [Pseudomonadota bacterium]